MKYFTKNFLCNQFQFWLPHALFVTANIVNKYISTIRHICSHIKTKIVVQYNC